MKLLILSTLVAVCSSSAIPSVPGDNIHYVEGESRYIWMPHGNSVPHLVDLHEPVDQAILNSKDGSNNQYWLFTRRNPRFYQVLTHNNISSVQNSFYEPNRGLKVIVHGWKYSGESERVSRLTSAFLAAQDLNVIVVDWHALASSNYVTASAGVPNVGESLGNFLAGLIDHVGGNWNRVHLVGFGMGAHVVGNAGRQTNGRPSRVTGLDPAGPLWAHNANALNSNAARYVEVIHTDAGVHGIMFNIGDADFYPNRGRHPQPGCLHNICSHERAIELFEESIRRSYFGQRCDSLLQALHGMCSGEALAMGNADFDKEGSGIYALRTGRAPL